MTDERRIASLPERGIDIKISCGCTKIAVVPPAWLLKRCGRHVTVEEAERRLVCRACGQRGRLSFAYSWAAQFNVDRGTPLPKVPDWVALLIGARS